jgi:hypothetical protein
MELQSSMGSAPKSIPISKTPVGLTVLRSSQNNLGLPVMCNAHTFHASNWPAGNVPGPPVSEVPWNIRHDSGNGCTACS